MNCSNLEHMSAVHGFYIPDLEYLVDPEGLVEHLLEQVVECRCLGCDKRGFDSAHAAQQHMADKGHCRMQYDEERHLDEYADFYDFTPSDEDGDGDGGGEDKASSAQPSSAALILAGSALPTDATVTNVGDLALPSGRTARSRHLMRYYKQRFTMPDMRESVRINLDRLALAYQSAGHSTSTALSAVRMASLSAGTRGNVVSPEAQRKQADYLRRMELHTGLQMNQIRRKHFRVALLV
jgi:pre-60S factor REI1